MCPRWNRPRAYVSIPCTRSSRSTQQPKYLVPGAPQPNATNRKGERSLMEGPTPHIPLPRVPITNRDRPRPRVVQPRPARAWVHRLIRRDYLHSHVRRCLPACVRACVHHPRRHVTREKGSNNKIRGSDLRQSTQRGRRPLLPREGAWISLFFVFFSHQPASHPRQGAGFGVVASSRRPTRAGTINCP